MAENSYKIPDPLVPYLRDNSVLVHCIPAIGPHSGIPIVAVSRRSEVMEIIKSIMPLKNAKRRRMLKSVQRAIAEVLMNPNNPTTDPGFLDDVAILLAFRLALRNDDVLQQTGLSSLMLWVDPDDTLEWSDRGMLDPELLESLGISSVPIDSKHQSPSVH